MDEIMPGPEPEARVTTLATQAAPPGTDLAAFVDEQARRRRAMLIETWRVIAKQTMDRREDDAE